MAEKVETPEVMNVMEGKSYVIEPEESKGFAGKIKYVGIGLAAMALAALAAAAMHYCESSDESSDSESRD